MPPQHDITRDNIMDIDDYLKVRSDRKRAVDEITKKRYASILPAPPFYFKTYDTVFQQIHTMLYS